MVNIAKHQRMDHYEGHKSRMFPWLNGHSYIATLDCSPLDRGSHQTRCILLLSLSNAGLQLPLSAFHYYPRFKLLHLIHQPNIVILRACETMPCKSVSLSSSSRPWSFELQKSIMLNRGILYHHKYQT